MQSSLDPQMSPDSPGVADVHAGAVKSDTGGHRRLHGQMFPLVHPGVAYLVYAGYVRLDDGRPPGGTETLALVLGAVVPDLVDQPLYHLGTAPTTRTIGHSLLAGVVLSALVVLAVRRTATADRVGRAFAAGYFLHLLADAVWPIVLWLPAELRYLGWPIVQQPPYEGTKPLLAIGGVVVTTLWVEIVLLVVAIIVWWRGGRPGDRHTAG